MKENGLSRVALLGFALGQLAVVGWVDYATGYEVSVAILYYFPIAFAAWQLGMTWSLGFALLCAGTLTWVDVASGHHYSHEWMMLETGFMRLLGFGFVAFSFNYFKKSIERERDKVRRLEGVVTFCSCCSKVRDEEGGWQDLETLLKQSTDARAQPKLCPDCARSRHRNAETA